MPVKCDIFPNKITLFVLYLKLSARECVGIVLLHCSVSCIIILPFWFRSSMSSFFSLRLPRLIHIIVIRVRTNISTSVYWSSVLIYIFTHLQIVIITFRSWRSCFGSAHLSEMTGDFLKRFWTDFDLIFWRYWAKPWSPNWILQAVRSLCRFWIICNSTP